VARRIDRETLRNASPEILPVLIRHLPAGQLDRALEFARKLDDPALRAQALAAMYTRTSDRALLDEAIQASSGMEAGREYALLELAEQLPAEARGEAIETALGSTVNEDEFGYALEWALRIAPAELLPKLTTYFRRVTDRGYRVTALRAIGVRVVDLDRATREAVVAEARASKPRTRPAALAAIAPLLDQAERDGLVKLSLRRASREPPDLALAPLLVPLWPEPERLSLLAQWLTWEGYDEDDLQEPLLGSIEPAGIEAVLTWLRPAFQAGQVNATSLAAVAARLTEDGQMRVLALARAMHRGEARSDMLAELVPVLRPAALRRALMAARKGQAREDWARALSIAASSVDQSLVPLAADIVRTSRSRSASLRGLTGLAGRAEGALRRALVGHVIGELAAAREGEAEMAVSDLAPILAPDEADAIAAIGIDRTALGDPPWMLSPLADALTSSSFGRVLDRLAPVSGDAVAGLISYRKRPLSAGAYRRAVRVAGQISDVGLSARALSDLVAMPGEAVERPTAEAVLDMARESSDDGVISQVITTLAPRLPATLAYTAARKVGDPFLRRLALEAVLPFAAGDQAAKMRRQIARLPEGGMGAGGGDGGPSLSESLGDLSPTDAGSAAAALLGALDGSPTATAARLSTTPSERTAEASRALPHAPPRSAGVVSTGFADLDEPRRALDPDVTLAAGRRYLFWFELGAPVAGSIEAAPVQLMVPAGSVRLVVLLYSPDGDIDVGPGRAEFETGRDGSFVAAPGPGESRYEAGGRRVGIAVSMPVRPGVVRLRCSVLAHGVLLQSRLITAHLTDEPRRRARALRSVLDYDIAPSLQAASVADRVPHALSILLNEAGDSHTFYFAGGGDDPKLVGGADISPLVIQSVVNEARDALRLASWGSDAEWDGQAPYAYEKPADADQLRTDLVRFANRGYALYNSLLEALGYAREEELCALLRQPTFVQMAHLADPRLILPVAMVYDRDLDTGMDPAEIKLCPAFLTALATKQDLKATSCWNGDCPSAGKDTVVCPSGFWGFRHAIGVPLTFRGGREAARRIARSAPVSAVAAVSTDPAFRQWADHATVLEGMQPRIDWTFAFDRDDALAKIVDRSPQLVYFYCHGGVANGRPYLRVGSADGPLIFGETFRTKHIDWADPRPMVLVNGCHTTALGPEVVQPLVSGLMFTANAAGVIGTEVTIFEPLAVEFAEAFLREFDAGSMLGWAVRDARLTLLGHGNPLGLVYIPYAAADLELA
jgi:hypothetical protein